MMFTHKQTGYLWKFKGFKDDMLTLYNKHEDISRQVSKEVIKSQYEQVVPRDRNGFIIEKATKVWQHG